MTRTARLARHLCAGLIIAAIVLSVSGCTKACNISAQEYSQFDPKRIAHAGGGINGKTYTNSYDALNFNIKNGFDYFEIDFSFTSDGKLVCIHDWHQRYENAFGITAGAIPDLIHFEMLLDEFAQYKNCTLDGLANWMRANREAVIITDVKDDIRQPFGNLQALQKIREALPDPETRVIPQIYNPHNFRPVREMGFEKLIWTLYRYPGSNKKVIQNTGRFDGPFAITMDSVRGKSELPLLLAELNIPTYVHTINDPDRATWFRDQRCVSEIYTDFLSPAKAGQ